MIIKFKALKSITTLPFLTLLIVFLIMKIRYLKGVKYNINNSLLYFQSLLNVSIISFHYFISNWYNFISILSFSYPSVKLI